MSHVLYSLNSDKRKNDREKEIDWQNVVNRMAWCGLLNEDPFTPHVKSNAF